MRRVSEIVAGFEGAATVSELQIKLQAAIEAFGFSAYNFFDAGMPHVADPYYFGSTGEAWETEYKSNNFVFHDPVLSLARRRNTPFMWREAPMPLSNHAKRPAALQLMDAAHDHGFKEGYILPFHFVDYQGRNRSALVALFWKDSVADLDKVMCSIAKHELNLVLLYWIERLLTVNGRAVDKRGSFTDGQNGAVQLTDREREILTWAGRGRSASETADILKISQVTVQSHLVNAFAKLTAVNKTHAVAKAVKLGLIDL